MAIDNNIPTNGIALHNGNWVPSGEEDSSPLANNWESDPNRGSIINSENRTKSIRLKRVFMVCLPTERIIHHKNWSFMSMIF